VVVFKRVEGVKGGTLQQPNACTSSSKLQQQLGWRFEIAGGTEQSKHFADDVYSLQVRVVCVLPVVRKSPASSLKAAGVGRLAQTT